MMNYCCLGGPKLHRMINNCNNKIKKKSRTCFEVPVRIHSYTYTFFFYLKEMLGFRGFGCVLTCRKRSGHRWYCGSDVLNQSMGEVEERVQARTCSPILSNRPELQVRVELCLMHIYFVMPPFQLASQGRTHRQDVTVASGSVNPD